MLKLSYMENNNASATPSVAPTTPTQSSVNATAPVQKKDNKKAIIIACIAVGACILLTGLSYFLSRAAAQRRLDETLKVCNENGLLSTKCQESQKENDVKCDILTKECKAEFKFRIF